jgi:hypothetical protein
VAKCFPCLKKKSLTKNDHTSLKRTIKGTYVSVDRLTVKLNPGKAIKPKLTKIVLTALEIAIVKIQNETQFIFLRK